MSVEARRPDVRTLLPSSETNKQTNTHTNRSGRRKVRPRNDDEHDDGQPKTSGNVFRRRKLPKKQAPFLIVKSILKKNKILADFLDPAARRMLFGGLRSSVGAMYDIWGCRDSDLGIGTEVVLHMREMVP